MSKYTRRKYLQAGAFGVAGVAGLYIIGGFGSGPSTPECETNPPADLDAPTLGQANSGPTVAEYSDFSCPHCRQFALNVMPTIRQQYIRPGAITYRHYDFPIPVDDWSRPAASAAREVQRRAGDTAYARYAMDLYRHQDDYSYDLFATLAENVHVAPRSVRKAAQNHAYCRLLNKNIQKGQKKGVKGTPTVFVDNKKNSKRRVRNSSQTQSKTADSQLPVLTLGHPVLPCQSSLVEPPSAAATPSPLVFAFSYHRLTSPEGAFVIEATVSWSVSSKSRQVSIPSADNLSP
jgi:hypothetical protein